MENYPILLLFVGALCSAVGYALGNAQAQPLQQKLNDLRSLFAQHQIDTNNEIAKLRTAYINRIKIVCNQPKTHPAQDSDYIFISDPLGIDKRTQPRLFTYEADTVALQRAKDMPHLCK